MSQMNIPEFVPHDLQTLSIEISRSQLTQLARFLDLLLEANRHFNLTAIRDGDEAWRRHIIDSLTLIPFLGHVTSGESVVDVGTGGGLPGIPLAIVRNDLRVVLLEATGKKAQFCERTVQNLGLRNIQVVNDRAENIGHRPSHREQYAAAVCRAIGPITQVLEYAAPLVRISGNIFAMKGPKAKEELNSAGDALDLLGSCEVDVFEAYPPIFGRNTVNIMITKRSKTPKAYPRRPGVPRSDPL